MRSSGPRSFAVLSIIAIAFMIGITSFAFAGNNPDAKVAVHVRAHNAKLACSVTIADCEDIVETEAGFSVDAFPVFYSLSEYLGVEYGMTWPAWSYSAAFTSCTDLVIGGISNPGDGAAHTWTACQTTSVAVPSFIWLYADAPGQICMTDNPDATPVPGIFILDCAEGLDSPCGLFCAGVYGAVGDDPCDPCGGEPFDPLVLDKIDNANICIDPSATLTYTITYSNPNADPVNNVVLTDNLPADVNYISDTGGGNHVSGVVTWSLGTLAGEAGGSIEVVVEVDATADYGSILVNNAEIVSDETDATSIDHSTTVCDYQYQALILDKTDNIADCVARGDEITYTISYENPNLFAVSNTILSDELPDGVTYVSSTPPGIVSGATVDWDLGVLGSFATGAVELVVSVDTGTSPGTVLINNSLINSDETDITYASVETAVCAATYDPLVLSKADNIGECVERGAEITYTIDYINPNDDGVTGVVLEDVLPDNTTFVSATGGGTESGGIVTWELGSVAGSGGGTVDLVIEVDAGGPAGVTLTNDCSITSTETGPTSASELTDVCAAVYDPLILSKVDDIDGCIERGFNITYTIDYSNPNQDGVTGVVLEDVLPLGTNFVSATGGGAESGGTVTWDIGPLAGSGGGSVDLIVEVDPGGAAGVTLNNNCSITSNETISTPATEATEVCAGAYDPLNLSKVDDIDGCVERGSNITYTIDYNNPNQDGVTVVVLEDVLPSGTNFVSATGGGTESGGTVTWDLGSLAGSGGGSVDLVVEVDPGSEAGVTLINDCSITSDETGATFASLGTEVCAAAVFDPLLLTKVDDIDGCAELGAQFTYTIDYSNPNDDGVTGVVLEDDLPPGINFVSATGGGTETAPGIVTWDLGSLVGLGGGSVDLVVEVDPGGSGGVTLVNQISITSTETEPTFASEMTDICAGAVFDPLLLTKVDDIDGCAELGAQFTYTIDYSNPNDDGVTGVVLEDDLPPGINFVSATGGGTETAPGIVTWDLGSLVGLGGGSVDLVVEVDPGGSGGVTLVNQISITSTETEATFASEMTDICAAAVFDPLLLTKVDDIDGCAELGAQFTYTIDYSNPNDDGVTGVVLEDDLPPGINFVSATGGGTETAPGIVTWDLGSLVGLGGGSVDLVVEVDPGGSGGVTLVNQISITSTETEATFASEMTDVCGTGEMPLDVDIKPGSCPNPFNTKAKGKLPVAILGSSYLDVYDIDPATVMLEGVPFVNYSYEDVATPVVDGEPCECSEAGSDGVMDLVMHFDRPELTTALGLVSDGEMVEMMLMATTYAGQVMQGSDCVWIIQKPVDDQAAPDVTVVGPDVDGTTILLSTQESADIKIVIYDVHGREVARLLDEYKAAGSYEVIWNGRSNGVPVPAGVYFATASSPEASTTRKFVVVK